MQVTCDSAKHAWPVVRVSQHMKRKHSKWTWADSFKAAKAGKRKRDSIETDQQAKADIGSWPKPTPKRGETTNG